MCSRGDATPARGLHGRHDGRRGHRERVWNLARRLHAAGGGRARLVFATGNYHCELSQGDRGEDTDIVLQPRDIVYVPLSPYRYLRRYAEIILNTFVTSTAINAGSYAVTKQQGLGAGRFHSGRQRDSSYSAGFAAASVGLIGKKEARMFSNQVRNSSTRITLFKILAACNPTGTAGPSHQHFARHRADLNALLHAPPM